FWPAGITRSVPILLSVSIVTSSPWPRLLALDSNEAERVDDSPLILRGLRDVERVAFQLDHPLLAVVLLPGGGVDRRSEVSDKFGTEVGIAGDQVFHVRWS